MSYCLGNKLNQEENQIDIQQQVPAKKPKLGDNPDQPQDANAVPEAPVLPQNFQIEEQANEEIPDDQLIKALELIEKENVHLFQNEEAQKMDQPQNHVAPVSQPNNAQPLMPAANAINFNNVANYAMANNNPFPAMYFSNSNVTINYNYSK